MRKRRGVKPGVPDVLVIFRKGPIFVELKSRQGLCSPSQRTAREAILRAGAQWWVARSANAAMWSLARSGVRFRSRMRNDGTTEHWWQPRLAPWEVPRRDPAEPRPNAPDVAARRRAARRRWRECQPLAREDSNVREEEMSLFGRRNAKVRPNPKGALMSQREGGYRRKPLRPVRNPGMGNAGADPASARVHRQDLGASMWQREAEAARPVRNPGMSSL